MNQETKDQLGQRTIDMSRVESGNGFTYGRPDISHEFPVLIASNANSFNAF